MENDTFILLTNAVNDYVFIYVFQFSAYNSTMESKVFNFTFRL